MSRRLGGILLDAKVLTKPSLDAALGRQSGSGKRLGAVLVEMGLVDQQTVVAALGVQADLPVLNLHDRTPERDAIALLPEDLARALHATALRQTPLGLEVAIADPLGRAALARLEKAVGGRVVLRLVSADDLARMIHRAYAPNRKPARSRLDRKPTEAKGPLPDQGPELLSVIVADALHAGASDVHIEVGSAPTRVRYRVAGALSEGVELPATSGTAVMERVKQLAGMVPRSPQTQSRFTMSVGDRVVGVFVTLATTVQGERVRLRLVPVDDAGVRRLDQLGMPLDVLEAFTAHLQGPSGLIVITGPRGSGRTTTAHAAIGAMDTQRRSIVMLERMVFCAIPAVTQIEVGAGSALSALSVAVDDQDADAVVIDELEGAGVVRRAVRMGQRGTLVVMTVTALDEAATVAQFLGTGVPRSALDSALVAVLAQRFAPSAEEGVARERSPVFELFRNMPRHPASDA